MNADIDILIIDDDEDMSYTLSRMVEQAGYRSRAAFSIGEGIAAAGNGGYDLVFLDVNLPDGSGLDIIPDLKRLDNAPEIIIFTAYGDPEGAAVALGNNVWDYIAKPARMDDIRLTMMRALDYRRQKLQKKPVSVDRSAIIGNSPQMAACIETLIIAANSSANVLITGETGTGKELFAKAVHSNSNRAGKPFVIVDCAALPDTLVESILFGHVRGAFTGADRDTRGLVGQADGGTLFLDELGELPQELQKVFLRVIQEHSYRPVGANHQERSDFRLIAATNRDLDSMVESGRFRKDLLHRTRTLELRLLPLRERKRDIRDLVHFQLARICDQYGIGTKGLAPEVLETLSAHDWPGNVRELFNTLEMAFSTAFHEQTIFHYHLPTQLRVKVKARAFVSAAPSLKQPLPPPPAAAGEFPTMEEVVDSARVDYLRKLLAATAGNITEACRRSGLSRTTLYNYLSKYGLTPGKNRSRRLQGGGS
jgi:two-component system NtrC family response regulator